MIYLDASVALAHLLAEDRTPPAELWAEPLVSSRLFEYELWTRIHARELGESHRAPVLELLGRVAFVEMVGPVLEEAVRGYPVSVRTLDALHLASVRFLRGQGARVRLASYDRRLVDAARSLEVPLFPLEDAA